MGDIREAKRLMAILALADEQDMKATACILQVTVEEYMDGSKNILCMAYKAWPQRSPQAGDLI